MVRQIVTAHGQRHRGIHPRRDRPAPARRPGAIPPARDAVPIRCRIGRGANRNCASGPGSGRPVASAETAPGRGTSIDTRLSVNRRRSHRDASRRPVRACDEGRREHEAHERPAVRRAQSVHCDAQPRPPGPVGAQFFTPCVVRQAPERPATHGKDSPLGGKNACHFLSRTADLVCFLPAPALLLHPPAWLRGQSWPSGTGGSCAEGRPAASGVPLITSTDRSERCIRIRWISRHSRVTQAD